MAADLLACRGLARAQDHGERVAGGGVIDMDGQEAALVVVGTEQRQLLMAVNDIERVVDVERHHRGRRGIARQPQIHQHIAEPDDGLEVR